MGSGDMPPNKLTTPHFTEIKCMGNKWLLSWAEMARTRDGAFLGLRKCTKCREPIEIIRYSRGPCSVLYSIQPKRTCHFDHTGLL